MSYKQIIENLNKKENIDSEMLKQVEIFKSIENKEFANFIFSTYLFLIPLSILFYFYVNNIFTVIIALICLFLGCVFFILNIIYENKLFLRFSIIFCAVTPYFNILTFLTNLLAIDFKLYSKKFSKNEKLNSPNLISKLASEYKNVEDEINKILISNINNLAFIEKMENDIRTKELIENLIINQYKDKEINLIQIHKNKLKTIKNM